MFAIFACLTATGDGDTRTGIPGNNDIVDLGGEPMADLGAHWPQNFGDNSTSFRGAPIFPEFGGDHAAIGIDCSGE